MRCGLILKWNAEGKRKRGFKIVCCFEALKSLALSLQGPFKSSLSFIFPRVQCFTCRVASSPYHSLPTSLLSFLPPVLVLSHLKARASSALGAAPALQQNYLPLDIEVSQRSTGAHNITPVSSAGRYAQGRRIEAGRWKYCH